MNYRFGLLGVVAFAAAAGASAQGAETETFFGGEFSGNVAITSDYIFRGISQTAGDPTVQGGFDWASEDFYAGIWASGVDFGDGTSAEVDFYGGWTPSIGAVDFNVGILYYLYPAAPQDPQQNYVEFILGASTTLAGFLNVGIQGAYSPDYYLEAGDSLFLSGTAGFPVIPPTPLGNSTFSASFGGSINYLEFFQDEVAIATTFPFEDYVTWDVGATLSYYGFDLDLKYVAETGLAASDSDSFVATLSRSF